MFFKFNYGFYPVQNCSLKLVEMQSKMYLSLTTLTGANLVNEEIALEAEEDSANNFMNKLTKYINSNAEKYDELVVDLDLFLKEVTND